MIRWLLVFLLLVSTSALAEDDFPFVEISVSPEAVMVGDSLTLEVIVYVPTWFSGTPVFPSFELTNSITRLPPDSSYPTSKQINGDTWSGIVRHYQVSPLIAANFELKDQFMKVSWANPGKAPSTADLRIPDISYRGIVPVGAEELNPFVAGKSLTIERTTSDIESLKPGDAIVLESVAELDGLPGFFIPELSVELPEGIRAYPSEPVVAETTRREKITLVLDNPGQLTVPGKTISWWHTEKAQIETTRIEPLTLVVAGTTGASTLPDSSGFQFWIIGLLLGVPLVVFVVKVALKALEPDQETLAFRAAKRALQSADAHEAYRKMTAWSQTATGNGLFEAFPENQQQTIEALSKHVYGESTASVDFKLLLTGLVEARAQAKEQKLNVDLALPPLNP